MVRVHILVCTNNSSSVLISGYQRKAEYSMATKLPSRTSLNYRPYPGVVCESSMSRTCLMVEKQMEVLDNSWLGGSSFGACPGFRERLQCLGGGALEELRAALSCRSPSLLSRQ